MGLSDIECYNTDVIGDCIVPKTTGCVSCINWCDPTLQDVLYEAKKSCGCLPEVICENCPHKSKCGYAKRGGSCTTTIHLCNNAPAGCGSDESTLIHEYVHARQACDHNSSNESNPFTFCEDIICQELEAYTREKYCDNWWLIRDYNSKVDCLCASACNSVPKYCKLLNDCEKKCKKYLANGNCQNGNFHNK